MGAFFCIHGVLLLAEMGAEQLMGSAGRARARAGSASSSGGGSGSSSSSSSSSISSSGASYQWTVEILAAVLSCMLIFYTLEAKRMGLLEVCGIAFLAAATAYGVLHVHRQRVVDAVEQQAGDTAAAAAGAAGAAAAAAGAGRGGKSRGRVGASPMRHAKVATTPTSNTPTPTRSLNPASLLLHHPLPCVRVLLGFCWTLSVVILTLPLFSLPVYHAMNTLYSHSFVVGPLLRALPRLSASSQEIRLFFP